MAGRSDLDQPLHKPLVDRLAAVIDADGQDLRAVGQRPQQLGQLSVVGPSRGFLALSFDHDRMAVEVVQNDPVFKLEL